MKNPPGLKYSKDHAWVKTEDNKTATIGITDFGQDSMGEISYVELPEPGKEMAKEQLLLSIGSSKAFIDLPSPVSGKILEVSETTNTNPTIINKEPYDKGWLVKLSLSRPEELALLMDNIAYGDFVLKETT